VLRGAIIVLLQMFAVTDMLGACQAAGAYAVGRNERGSWGGGATNYNNFGEAARNALAHCEARGPGCLVVTYFSNRCFALAISPGTASYHWATRDSLASAQQIAMDHCLFSGRRCELKVSTCDTREVEVREAPIEAPKSVPMLSQQTTPRNETPTPQVGSESALLLVWTIVAVAIAAIVFQKRSFQSESDWFSATESANEYDLQAARYRAMSRKLDAETKFADSFINSRRKQAELDDHEELDFS
jgi:hypothetical protein